MLFVNKKIFLGTLLPSLGSLGFFNLFSAGEESEKYKIMVNYNGQADLLLSLQIYPDYYPYQFKKTQLYDYLTHINKYIVVNGKTSTKKKTIKDKMQNKINELLGKIKEFGPSLWNEDLYDTGIVFRNNQFWNKKETSVLFLEQFISDDYKDVNFEALDVLPKYKDLIVTNYRAARDPYTIFSKNVFDCYQLTSSQSVSSSCSEDNEDKKIATSLKKYLEDYNEEDVNALYRTGKYIEFWKKTMELSPGTESEGSSTSLNLSDWIKKDKLFSLNDEEDKKIAQKYSDTIFDCDEVEKIKEWKSNKNNGWKINYLNSSNNVKTTSGIRLTHHPALEQQKLPGTAPLSEGSQKDIVMFLIQFAKLIERYTKGSSFNIEFANDDRKTHMQEAVKNTTQMAKDIKERIKNIRGYFKKIKVVDNSFDPDTSNYSNTNSKTFSVVTFPPTSFGAGEATIQSMSKFPFIYRDIGLKQPIPSNLQTDQTSQCKDHDFSNEIFSVDDNGWWWKIGDARIDPTNLLAFKGKTDTMLLLAHEDDWNILNNKDSPIINAIGTMLTGNKKIELEKINKKNYPVSYNKYHLWNEGLRSPIALNLLLDNLVDIFQRQYDQDISDSSKSDYEKAMDWGDYWSDQYFFKNLK